MLSRYLYIRSADNGDEGTGNSVAHADGAAMNGSGGATEAVLNEATNTGRAFKIPMGNKKAVQQRDQNRELGRGASGIISLAKAAYKRVK